MKIKKALHCCTESILRIKPVIWNCNSNIIKHNGMPSMQEQQKEKKSKQQQLHTDYTCGQLLKPI